MPDHAAFPFCVMVCGGSPRCIQVPGYEAPLLRYVRLCQSEPGSQTIKGSKQAPCQHGLSCPKPPCLQVNRGNAQAKAQAASTAIATAVAKAYVSASSSTNVQGEQMHVLCRPSGMASFCSCHIWVHTVFVQAWPRMVLLIQTCSISADLPDHSQRSGLTYELDHGVSVQGPALDLPVPLHLLLPQPR